MGELLRDGLQFLTTISRSRTCGWRIVVSPMISWDFPSCYDSADARSGRSFHPLHRDLGPLARTWRRPLHRCGVASPQAPTPDPESLSAPIAEIVCKTKKAFQRSSKRHPTVKYAHDPGQNLGYVAAPSARWPRLVQCRRYQFLQCNLRLLQFCEWQNPS